MATTPTNNLSRLFQTAGTAKPQQGTGYTNLNRLFEANKQNQLGQKVAGDLGGQIGGVQTQLQQQQKQFNEESEKNKVGGQKDVEQREAVLGRFSSASGAGDQVTEDETKAFGRFTAGQYGGPESLKDTSGLRQTAQQLQGQVSNFSPSGTQELLRQSVGGNRYTQGQSRLDSLLMDRSKLTPVARQAQGLGQEIQRADLAAQGLAESNKNTARQFGQETTEKLKGALGGLDTAAQAQLATAQTAENDRLARVQAIQDFAAGKVAKKDEAGNTLKDQYGNTIYDTINPRGSTNQYEQIDALQQLLKSNGIQDSELSALFGQGNINQAKDQASSADNAQRAALNQQLQKALDESNWTHDNERITQIMQRQARQRAAAIQAQMNALNSFDPSKQGIAGAAVQKGATEPFFQNIASILGNSQAAQGLTESGVASDALRGNYSALQQLLGQGADTSKFSDTDQRYSAGKMLVDPEQLKRSLGL